MAVTTNQLHQAVEAENERLNKIDVEKVRTRLESISSLKRQKVANQTYCDEQNAKLDKTIAELQEEVAKLQFNEVSIADLAPAETTEG